LAAVTGRATVAGHSSLELAKERPDVDGEGIRHVHAHEVVAAGVVLLPVDDLVVPLGQAADAGPFRIEIPEPELDDWRLHAAKLNEFPQFLTEIDGLDVHFLHVPSPKPDAIPLILTHGWPSSVVEFASSLTGSGSACGRFAAT
jgi:hypothetical protein